MLTSPPCTPPAPDTSAGRLHADGTSTSSWTPRKGSWKLIGQNDDFNGGRNARIEAKLQPGTYFVQVRHYSASGAGPYRIWVAG